MGLKTVKIFLSASATICSATERASADKNPDAFDPDPAISYWNSGLFYKGQGRWKSAIETFTKAKEIYVRLEDKNPGLYSKEIQALDEWIGELTSNTKKKGFLARLFGKK